MTEQGDGVMPTADEDPEILRNRVWFNLLRAHRNLYPRMERILKEHGLRSPVWYEILLEISRSGDSGIRSVDLQSRLYMTQYNLSRHVSRMVKAGLVDTIPSARDGRSSLLRISPQGRKLLEDVWPAYKAAIQAELGPRFDNEQAYELFRGLILLYP